MSQSPEHSSWKTRGLHSCHSIHAWRNLGTSGESSVMQVPTSVFYAYNVSAMQCNVNAFFGICFLRWKLLPSSKLAGRVRTPATWTDWIFFSVTDLDIFGSGFWHQANHFTSLFISLLSVILQSPVHIIREMDLREYPIYFGHIQDIATWNSFLWFHS